MKLMVISTNLNRPELWKRWLILKNKFTDIDIELIVPAKYETGNKKAYSFGKVFEYKGTNYTEDRFKVIPINITQNKLGGWSSPDIKSIILSNKPDVIYYIGVHASISLRQVIKAASRVGSKVYVFTMRGDLKQEKGGPIKHRLIRMYNNILDNYNVSHSDAIFVHYPDAVQAFINKGYKGPIFINTQIGVDTEFFKFTEEGRQRIRKELGIEDCFVFGGASRLNAEKGVLDVIRALPQNYNIKFMILGSGTDDDINAIKKTAEECGVTDQIIMPGLIGWDKLCDYLSAMDCAVHVPHRTKTWVETFSLALVQEMSVGLPVIGSRSGSVPYQIGDDTLLVNEKDIAQINAKMLFLINNKNMIGLIGLKNRQRCIDCFDSKHIAECLGIVLHELQKGEYNRAHIDTAENWS